MKFFLLFYTVFFLVFVEASRKDEVKFSNTFQHFMQTGQYLKAIGTAKDILNYTKKKPFSAEREITRTGMYLKISETYLHLHDKEKSLYWLEKLAIENPKYIYASHRKRLIVLYMSLATKSYTSKKYKRAALFQKQAYALAEIEKIKVFDRISFAMNLGVYLMYDGAYTEAIYYQSQALERAKKLFKKDNVTLASMFNTLALTHLYAGNLRQVSSLLKSALDMKKRLGSEDESLIKIYNNFAFLYQELGNVKEALIFYQKSIALIHKLDMRSPELLAVVYHNVANVYLEEKNLKMAGDFYKKALRSMSKNNPDLAYIYSGLGSLAVANASEVEAERYFKKAIKIRKKNFGSNYIYLGPTYLKLAQLFMQQHHYEKALSYEKKVESLLQENKNKNTLLNANLHLNMANTYSAMHRDSLAYKHVIKAWINFLAIKESAFGITSQKEKLYFKQSHQDFLKSYFYMVYRYAMKLSGVERQDVLEEALINWVQIKRSIFEENDNFRLLAKKTNDNKVKEKVKELFKIQQRLGHFYSKSISDLKKYPEQVLMLQSLEKRIGQLEEYLSYKMREEHMEVLPKEAIRMKALSSKLQKDTLYMDFVATAEFYYMFTLTHLGKVGMHVFDRNETNVMKETVKSIQEENKNIASKAHFADLSLAYRYYGELFDLIHSKVDFKKYTSLIISADGALNLLPFEALYDRKEKQFLLETVSVKYISSARDLLKDDQNVSTEGVVVFADPDFDMHSTPKENELDSGSREAWSSVKFSQLPGTRKEANEIRHIFPKSMLYMEENATEENLLKLNSPHILHIATHGFFEKDSSVYSTLLNSGIVLSGVNKVCGSRDVKGVVNGLELAGLSLQGTDLVVLSSCYSGMGEVEEGEGLSGLADAFKKAGAKNIVTSLWAVNDSLGEILMRVFYENIAKHKGYAESLKQAKLYMLKEGYIHPYYWGGFLMHGKGR